MAINKRVAAAMKKVAKPKRKKTWADSQSAPQSKVYKAANDKAVLAKPVGFRWTDLGAARLGKNASVKPSAADIEKYKGKTFSKGGEQHSYLYSEKRADKTDVKKSEKFKAGGRPKKTWADSQNPPQSTVYKAVNDKEVVAKPVGFRWTGYGANKLGVNVMSKPSAADIEQYKNKTFKLRGESVRYLYSEKRADKSDVKRKDKFEDGGMYADGGETYFDKQASMKGGVDYYSVEMDDIDGEQIRVLQYNSLKTAKKVYDRVKKSMEWEGVKLVDVQLVVVYNDGDYDSIGDDFEDGGMYADGGETDKEYVVADMNYKIMGSFDTENEAQEYSRKLSKKDGEIYGFGTKEKIERFAKEDGYMAKGGKVKPFDIFEGDVLVDTYNGDEYKVKKVDKDDNIIAYMVIHKDKRRGTKGMTYISNGNLSHTNKRIADGDLIIDGTIKEDGGMMAKGGMFGGRQYDPYNEPADKARHAKPIGWRFTDAKAKRLKESPYEKPTAEQIEKYRGNGVYFENRQDKSDRTYSRKLADGGVSTYYMPEEHEKLRLKYISVDVNEDNYEQGEGRNVTSYSLPEYKGRTFDFDGEVLKFFYYELGLSMDTNDYVIIDNCIHFDQLQDEDGNMASEYAMEQWRKGEKVLYNAHYTICLDGVIERELSDRVLSLITGIGVYRSGGAVQSGVQSENYSEDRDKLVVAKPVGWRFTNKFAKRKGFDAYRKPTAEEIEKYKSSGKVYYEVRFDKSDKNARRRFEDGGMMEDDSYARGGAPKISNSESRSYTENMLPFRANNLEGKTLDNGDYVVLSYGYYPIWFYSAATHKWYGNKDKYSQSTAKQISQSRPSYDATILPKRELDEVMFSSSLGKLLDEERIADEANV
jgi:hypothetical protein